VETLDQCHCLFVDLALGGLLHQRSRWLEVVAAVAHAYFRSPVVAVLLANPAHISDLTAAAPQRALTATDERKAP